MGSDLLAALRASGASIFSQDNRILTLRFAESSNLGEDTLLPHHLAGEEGLSKNPRHILTCLSVHAYLELKNLIGQPVEIGLLLPDGGQRVFTGIVTAARRGNANGGFCVYVLTVESALTALALRRNSRNYQDMSVPEIVKALLDEHIAGNPVFAASFQYRDKLRRQYPKRSYCNQYRETDLAFIERLLAEEGITYRFSHGPDDDMPLRLEPSEVSDTPILHTLILQDADTAHPVVGKTPVRFHRTDGAEADDAIDSWEGERSVQSGQTSLTTWDYKGSTQLPADELTTHSGGKAQQDLMATLEDYDPQSAYYGSQTEEVGRYAELRQLAKDFAGKQHYGSGTPRHLFPGGKFGLEDHPVHDQSNPEDRLFVVTDLAFEAQNNLTPEAQTALGGLLDDTDAGKGQNRPPYRNTFKAVRHDTTIVPDYHLTRHQKPTAVGTTTALVVGPPDEEIFTDEHGRIKLQFHWQRKQDHPQGGADFDDHSSTWVRVAVPSAGAQWGTQYIPRIGQEVVVDFIEGDIDRPLVTGVVYNGSHIPPTFSGAGALPANKTLSGHKSKEYKGSTYNELLFDDSTGQMRVKLSSEHGKSQLNQGYLIHPRTGGKGEARGEGFELRTDHHGAVRAGQGLLLTTEAQPMAGGKQLARDLATSQLDAAYSLAKSLGEVATKQYADTLEHGPEKISPDNAPEDKTQSGHLKHHLDALKAWEGSSNTDPRNETAKDEAGRQPILVLASPAGIAEVTAQNHSIAAGTNIDQVAQRDLNQTSGRRWLHNAGQHISLFVNGLKEKISLKLIAAQGKVQMQAQHGEMELTAEQDILITSLQKKVVIAAKEEILLTAGGGYIRLKGGNIDIHCPGIVSIKGEKHKLSGPDSMNIGHPAFPNNLPKTPLVINTDHSPEGHRAGWAGMPYKLFADGAQIKEGVLDETGQLPIAHEVPTQKYKLELANGMIHNIPIPNSYSNPEQGEAANSGFLRHVAGKAPDTGATPQRANTREDYFKALKGDSENNQA